MYVSWTVIKKGNKEKLWKNPYQETFEILMILWQKDLQLYDGIIISFLFFLLFFCIRYQRTGFHYLKFFIHCQSSNAVFLSFLFSLLFFFFFLPFFSPSIGWFFPFPTTTLVTLLVAWSKSFQKYRCSVVQNTVISCVLKQLQETKVNSRGLKLQLHKCNHHLETQDLHLTKFCDSNFLPTKFSKNKKLQSNGLN